MTLSTHQAHAHPNEMKQSCCSVTFCPLILSWATTIHKFQGFEAGFDRNDQFQHLNIDPGDIKSEQQQPGILYVAMSRAKTMGDMINDMLNPRNSAVYWTGCGMSKYYMAQPKNKYIHKAKSG